MPHSPFTRIFGCVIVAAYALALLWPDDRAHVWGWYALFSLPIVIGLFTWSAVRGAPPFDDNAFHRTLPPGDGYAFRKVLLIHLMVLAGIALAVLIYCWIFNFGWSSCSYGIAILAIPVWAWMAANGVASSLTSSRKLGNVLGYLSVFIVPILMYVLWPGDRPESARWIYFSSVRTMVLTAAVLYPIIWWLVAAKRQWRLGMALGAATGVLMPWLYLYGELGEVKHSYVGVQFDASSDRKRETSHVTVSRKAVNPTGSDWLAVEKLLEVRGLREGEFFTAGEEVRVPYDRGASWGIPILRTSEYSDDPLHITSLLPEPILVGNMGEDQLGWGTRSIWKHLGNRIADVETLSFAHPERYLNMGPSIRMKHGDAHGYLKGWMRFTEAELSTTTWTTPGAGLFRFEKAGEIDGATGGFCRLPGGGSVRIEPVKWDKGFILIQAHKFFPDQWRKEGPWFDNKVDKLADLRNRLWIIAVDESGRHAVALNHFWGGKFYPVFLGRRFERQYKVSIPDGPGLETIADRLENCRLHVFAPVWVGDLPSEIPPPR